MEHLTKLWPSSPFQCKASIKRHLVHLAEVGERSMRFVRPGA